jgi:hypothetical protein
VPCNAKSILLTLRRWTGRAIRLRAELLLAWTQDEHAEDALVRRIEEAEERVQKIWNAANDR